MKEKRQWDKRWNNKRHENLRKSAEDNCEPVMIGNSFSSNYIEYESNGDKDKKLSIEEYLDSNWFSSSKDIAKRVLFILKVIT